MPDSYVAELVAEKGNGVTLKGSSAKLTNPMSSLVICLSFAEVSSAIEENIQSDHSICAYGF
jgi:hypothetical protein